MNSACLLAKYAAISAAVLATTSCGGPTSPSSTKTATTTLTISGATALTPGLSTQLTATVVGDGITSAASNVLWQSSAPLVATVSSTGVVTALTTGATTIVAAAAGAEGQVRITVQPLSSAAVTISACVTVTSPGTYSVTTDLLGNGNCLNILNTASVHIDCQGHSVSDMRVTNVSGADISRCTVKDPVDIASVESVTISNSSFMGGLQIDHGQTVTVSDSTIRSGLQQTMSVTSSKGIALLRDIVSNSGNGDVAGAIVFYRSSGNDIEQTHISSVYDGGPSRIGADDGIILNEEDGDTIHNNDIGGFFDIGIEGVGMLSNTKIIGNLITNVGTGGIGAIFCTDWTNNLIEANSTSRVPTLIFVGYQVDAAHCGTTVRPPAFVDNLFTANIFRDPINGTLHTSGAPGPGMSIVTQGTVSNNILTNNDFADYYGPNLNPLSGFVNGGGNICAPPADGISNFVCTNSSLSTTGSAMLRSGHR